MRRSAVYSKIVALLAAAFAIASCQTDVTMFSGCTPGSDDNPFGTDGEYVLLCEDGSWEPIMTVEEYVSVLKGEQVTFGKLPKRPATPKTTTTTTSTTSTTTTTIPTTDLGSANGSSSSNCSSNQYLIPQSANGYEVGEGDWTVEWFATEFESSRSATLRLVAVRPTGDPAVFTVIALGGAESFSGSGRHQFDVGDVPTVTEGDLIGMVVDSGNPECFFLDESTGFSVGNTIPGDLAVGSELTTNDGYTTGAGFKINLEVGLLPD